jgi:hypothetical protein
VIYEIETAPFDWLDFLCPLEEALRLCEQSEQDEGGVNWALVELQCLVQRANDRADHIGELRCPPRVLFLPAATSFDIVLFCKAENNGTCHWFSTSEGALRIVNLLMEY